MILGGKRKDGDHVLTLPEILLFSTGAEQEPPLGFSIRPTIHFVHSETIQLPTANTCVNQLSLPVSKDVTNRDFNPEPTYVLYDMAFASEYFGLS